MKTFAIVLAGCVWTAAGVNVAAAAADEQPKPAHASIDLTGSHGFDFLVGEWRVRHRRTQPNSREWVEFAGTCNHRLLTDGSTNVEEHALDAPAGAYGAIGLRSYDRKTGEWSIWWLDGRYPAGPLGPPVRGRFENGIGAFYSDYTQDGKPMRGRFLWSDITATSARWQQASSADGGATWQTNWIMDFTRVAPRENPRPSPVATNVATAAANTQGAHGFDFLVGVWRVHHQFLRAADRSWMELDGTCINRAMMGGAANIESHAFRKPGGISHGVALRSYDRESGEWFIWWLDSREPSGPLGPPLRGRFDDGVGTFYGDTTLDGRPIRVRFIWSDISSTAARWQQAYSMDAGKTWETNWVMQFMRDPSSARDALEVPAGDSKGFSAGSELRRITR